jgi:hypothetical protein
MGSQIDVLKLVSSMTLFREIAHRGGDVELAAAAEEILTRARAQGFSECESTLRQLSS